MRKSITIMKVQRSADDKLAYGLTKRLCERRLARRQASALKDPEIMEWFASAQAIHKLKMSDPDHEDRCDVFGDIVFSSEPSITSHPKYPKSLSRDEKLAIEYWVVERLKRVRRPGHPLSERIPDSEKKEIREAAGAMGAVCLTEHEIDVAFSDVHKQFPWLEELNERSWKQARRRAREGRPAGVGPLLLLGPPGIGKSSWSRAVADSLGVPRLDVDVGATGGVFDLQGTGKGWGSSDKGRLMSTIISTRNANPLIVLDEIDAGSRSTRTTGGSIPGLFKVLMGLIEPSTASAWVCPYYQVPVDMRHVSWIATSNDVHRVEQALLDRMTIIDLPDMTREQLIDFAAEQARVRFGDDFADVVVCRVSESLRRGHRLSLRHVVKILDRIEEALDRPVLH